MKSRYFANTLGVFEGGGVRAAAFAGAYAGAIEAGIKFNAVAGTSAGSIVAALIAAGAPSQFLLDELTKASFADLLSAPVLADRPFQEANRLATLGKMLPGKLGMVSTVVLQGGLYNSSEIEKWVEALLQQILSNGGHPSVSGRVTFRDLTLPVFVVSADITTAKPKIWSRTSTPEESVAFAVRCSSSIPFFFQPVRSNSSLHVDGGVISNLPSYVFAEAKPSSARYSERVLAFRLKSSPISADAKFPVSKRMDRLYPTRLCQEEPLSNCVCSQAYMRLRLTQGRFEQRTLKRLPRMIRPSSSLMEGVRYAHSCLRSR
jgi:predicted acylesterase/phospholipase RssA